MTETPKVGEIWDQKQTAAMRRERTMRAVRVESVYLSGFRGETRVMVTPAEGKGRSSTIELTSFLRKFTRRAQ